jgi:hypothetical protein
MNRCGIITAGVFAAIAGVLSIIKGVLVIISGTTAACSLSTYYTDDYYSTYYYDEDICRTAVIVASSLAFTGGVFWIATAACTLVFAGGSRIRKFEVSDDDDDVVKSPSAVTVEVETESQAYQKRNFGNDVEIGA